jgi:putative membrane protein
VARDHPKRGALTAGLLDGIARAGALLAQHFPPGAENPNELPDAPVGD